MAHEVSTGASGVWKRIRPWWTGSSGSWKRVLKAHVGVSGSWKLFYTDIPETLVALFASAPAAPWSALSYTDIFPLPANAEGGSDLYAHTHGHSSVANDFGNSTSEQAQNAALYHDVIGIHSSVHDYNHSHVAVDHQPLYQEWRAAQANGVDLLPTTAMLFYNSHSIPSGWSRATFTDGRFVKLNSSGTGGTGGNAQHSHSAHANGTTGSSTVSRQLNITSYPYHADPANHSHTVPSHAAEDNDPPGYYLDLISPNSPTAVIPSGVCAFFVGSVVPFGWSLCSAALNRLVRVSSSATIGADSGAVEHSHVFSSNSGTYSGSIARRGANGTSAAYINHNHLCTHTHDGTGTNNSMPLCRQLLFCQKD